MVQNSMQVFSFSFFPVLFVDKGVESFETDLKAQRVYVTSSGMTSDELLAVIKKTGKATTYIGNNPRN